MPAPPKKPRETVPPYGASPHIAMERTLTSHCVRKKVKTYRRHGIAEQQDHVGTAKVDLTSTSERLFAGICTTSRSSNPLDIASLAMSSRSRTPQRGLRRLRSASKAALVIAVCFPPIMNGPYRKRTPPESEQTLTSG